MCTQPKIHTVSNDDEEKEDMRKYNNILERMICVEQSTKSAHHRLDALE